MIIGKKTFDFKRQVYIMGILNVTPDSFSDGGSYTQIDKALYHVEDMISKGADIIDVGGESTRPNHTQISVQEEIDRVTPILASIKARFDIPISLDTYKSEVAKANLTNIDLINDIWGLKYDPNMANLIANSHLPCCLMHNRPKADYINFEQDIFTDLQNTIDIALNAEISTDKIILDPGIGFQKSVEQNLHIMNQLNKYCSFGFPILFGASRKSTIGHVLNKTVDNRIYGTLATTAVAVMNGASIIRVHDISENWDVIRMTKSIMGEQIWDTSK